MNILDRPGGIAILFSLVLLGMFIGFVPSQLSSQQNVMDSKLDKIITAQEAQKTITQTRYDTLQSSLNMATQRTELQNQQLIQIMRGMCLIIAKQGNDSNSALCNPTISSQ